MKEFDVIIIGGGASGLMCAIAAKRKKPQLSVAVIEKSDRVGKKLLSTGNGRCNLTNLHVSAKRYTGSFAPKMESILARYGADALLHYFADLGLLTSADSEGRVYPLCRQATAVLDVLRFQCEALGVEMFCGQTVKSIRRNDSFAVNTHEHAFTAEKLVIAAGSKAAPKLGGNGSAADYLKNLGHRFVPFSPALCPVRVQGDSLRALKGLRANAAVSLLKNGKRLKSESGEVQFNEDNLSGICVFDLSLYTQRDDVIALDLLPDISYEELFNILLSNQERFALQSADCLLTGILPKRTAQAVMKQAGFSGFSAPCSAFNNKVLQAIARTVKNLRFTVTENLGFDRAQACKGGVPGDEIDETTMQSRVCKDLYILGEAVDVCGECGGYNLHFAFVGGMIAGESL